MTKKTDKTEADSKREALRKKYKNFGEAPKRRWLLKTLFAFVLLAAAATGVLHYFDKLDLVMDSAVSIASGIVEKVKKKEEKAEGEKKVDEKKEVEKEKTKKEVAEEDAAEKRLVEKPESEPIGTPEMSKQKLMDSLVAKYRAEFKTPEIGAPISLTLRKGLKVAGILEALDDNTIRRKKERASVILERSKLTPEALAVCYEDNYVGYMLVQHQRREAEAREKENITAKLDAEREAQNKLLAGGPKTQPSKKEKSHSSDKMTMKEWMEKNPDASQALIERQKRIKEYEEQRAREGGVY